MDTFHEIFHDVDKVFSMHRYKPYLEIPDMMEKTYFNGIYTVEVSFSDWKYDYNILGEISPVDYNHLEVTFHKGKIPPEVLDYRVFGEVNIKALYFSGVI